MESVLFEYAYVIKGADGIPYRARTCGTETDDGRWQAWVEFLPPRGGTVPLSPRETVQPTRSDLLHWASQLTPKYLEGALTRALDRRALTLGLGRLKMVRHERPRNSNPC